MDRSAKVHGTELLATDTRQQYREKIARITLDSMVQFVGMLDAEGTVLEINKVALDAVGIKLSDVEGKPFWHTFWWQVSEEINTTLKQSIARAAQGEFVRWDTPIYGRAGGKETIIIDASLCPVKDEQGKVVFIAAEGRDITEKKAYEREIAQKNADLQSLLERIRELDEIKTQFFANVSHELRTPLALIIGPAERLLSDNSTGNPQEQRETAKVILRNARMLLKHVNDLLDISKLEAGKLKIELHDADVSALVRFVASHFDILAAERQVKFRVEAPQLCACAVDPEKLQRVLMNLLSNAFKFVPAGGTIRCALEQSPSSLSISVEDSGPGVKSELRKAIFERFRQGEGGANRQFGGTGLGLAIAHEFVELHKGNIQVLDSALGGALFQVTLPSRRLSSSAAASPTLEQTLDRGTLDGLLEELRTRPASKPTPQRSQSADIKPTVLVVEDNPDMNRFVAECLSRDFEVISAFDGQQGIEKALSLKPMLIVSDIMMPKVSGVEMIAQLRKHSAMREIPILLLSAKADEDLKIRLLQEGAQDFITKPFNERDLLVRVQNLIAQKRAEDALRIADRRKDEFLATLAHELRNPLAPLRHAAAISRSPQATEAQRRWSEEVIQRQVEHMARLLDDLLDMSRITAGRLELRKQRLHLQESLKAAVETNRPLIEARGHTLEIKLPAEAIYIDADPVRLAQIFSNLLTNAAKYTDPGGVIHIQATLSQRNVVVSVTDTGMGILPEQLPVVFEMFSQATSAIDRSEGGLGIGLSLVRGLVLLHNGSIEVRSQGLGHGSQFTVTLPLAAEVLPPKSSADSAAGAASNGQQRLRILVADDNADSAKTFAMLLQMSGHEVRTAHSGREALTTAAEFSPQVAVLDIGMPDMNGYDVARQIRTTSGGDQMILVAISGWSQIEDKRKAEDAGFDHHFAKPVDFKVFEPLLRQLQPPESR